MMEEILREENEHWPNPPSLVIIGGTKAKPHAVPQHVDIVADSSGDDLIDGPDTPLILETSDPEFVQKARGCLDARPARCGQKPHRQSDRSNVGSARTDPQRRRPTPDVTQ